MTRRDFGVGASTLALLALSACGVVEDYPPFRYRLTVEVATPQGLRTGSSVIELHYSGLHTGIGWASGGGYDVKGEAAAVDLGGGHVLFALLTRPGASDGAAQYVTSAFPMPSSTTADYFAKLRARRDVGVLPTSAYPMLVTFGDVRDPKSVVAVDPADLAKSFGAGTKLTRITVQMTDEPVTKAIEKRLGWLTNLDAYRTDPKNPFTNTLPKEIGGLRSK